MRSAAVLGILATALCGCGEDAPSAPKVTAGKPDAGGCVPGERMLEDGRCLAAGAQENGCAAGEQQVEGACAPAGVPPSACATGFEPDDGGCKPILPERACEPGTMALLGETTCHPVSPCGTGAWGDIAVEPSTEHVDAAYAGGASDGSAAAPWTTVIDAVAAAAPGAIVAVAAGSYSGDVVVDKPIRLYGRCPGLVELVGTTSTGAGVSVGAGSDGTEITGVAIRGASYGVSVEGSEDVSIHHVWIHDTASHGLDAYNLGGPTSFTLGASLFEHAGGAGVVSVTADALVEDVVIRDSVPEPGGYTGRGISIERGGHIVPTVVRRAVLERNHGIGIFVSGSAAIEGTLIRDTLISVQGGARGLSILEDTNVSDPATVELRGSVIQSSQEVGIMLVGGRLTVEDSVVRDTAGAPDAGRGLNVQQFPGGELRPSLTVRRSTIRSSSDLAVYADAGDVVLEGLAVRDSGTPGVSGDTLAVIVQHTTSATMVASAVEHSHGGGVAVFGSTALLEGVAVRDVSSDAHPLGPCISASVRANVTVRSSVLEQCAGVGALITGSDATIESTRIRSTRADGGGFAVGVVTQTTHEKDQDVSLALRFSAIEDGAVSGLLFQDGQAVVESSVIGPIVPASDGTMGDGIDIIAGTFQTQATIVDTRVERASRAAIASFGASVTVTSSRLECSAFDLEVEDNFGQVGSLDDGGGNVCGCSGASHACKALSANLAPPAPSMRP